uniref:Uncharacterized protein n=1 Tax=Oryza meridionalis TaxID=40149 RepID=A0A0E0F1X4_9ORYZ
MDVLQYRAIFCFLLCSEQPVGDNGLRAAEELSIKLDMLMGPVDEPNIELSPNALAVICQVMKSLRIVHIPRFPNRGDKTINSAVTRKLQSTAR